MNELNESDDDVVVVVELMPLSLVLNESNRSSMCVCGGGGIGVMLSNKEAPIVIFKGTIVQRASNCTSG